MMKNLFRNTGFARAMADIPLLCMDIGARGGVQDDLSSIAFAVDAIGFEPDAEAYKALQENAGDAPWRSVNYIPKAVSGSKGQREFRITQDPFSSTLLTPNPDIGARFNKSTFCTVERTVMIDTVTLDDAVQEFAPRTPDYIKIDVEGAEGEILGDGGAKTLDGLIALKTEVSFLKFRKEQPVFSELDSTLSDHGFELLTFADMHHWRRHGYVVHPHASFGDIPYSRGQMMHGDAIYVRRPDQLPPGIGADNIDDGERLLRAVWFLMAFGYFDHADALLQRPAASNLLSAKYKIDGARALSEASRKYGRTVKKRALTQQIRGILPLLRRGIDL